MYINKRRQKISYVVLIFLILVRALKVDAQQQFALKGVKLVEIDTISMAPSYYLLTFKDDKRRYQVISKSELKAMDGCWDFLVKNKYYNLNLTEVSVYVINGLSIQIKGIGLVTGGKDVLDNNEYFFKSKDINGILIRGN